MVFVPFYAQHITESINNFFALSKTVTDDRINKLNSINFSWDMKRKQRKSATRETVKFDVTYNHLVSFKETYGHTKVNKLEKEWKAGNGIPEKKVYRRLPLFFAFAERRSSYTMRGSRVH